MQLYAAFNKVNYHDVNLKIKELSLSEIPHDQL